MSTTPEITGRARGGGNGRPAAGTMHGRPVGSSESVPKTSGSPANYPTQGLFPRLGLPPVAGPPPPGALLPPVCPGKPPPHRTAVGRVGELLFHQSVRPRRAPGAPRGHQNRFEAHEPNPWLPRLIGIGIVGAFHAQSFAISRRLRWRRICRCVLPHRPRSLRHHCRTLGEPDLTDHQPDAQKRPHAPRSP